jgi:carbon starvation protein
MNLLAVVLLSAALLLTAYRIYGTVLARLFRLDPDAETPAVALKDGVDYDPIAPKFLLSQHFSAIAAAGPIVGPILAGIYFGWVPALIWILVGSIFIGGVHDMAALVASVRHKARSIAEVVRDHMSQRSYLLFLSFIWLALVYIIVAFTDVTAQSFVGKLTLENGQTVSGGGIATSSLLYLALPVIMGLVLRFTKVSLGVATLIFLPLVGLSIYLGQVFPFDIAAIFNMEPENASRVWSVALLLYCLVAAVAPVWLLLQPRGHLGGYFLFVALAGSAVGLLFGGHTIRYPAFTGWESAKGGMLFPFLFITIACGACSGFHSLIASGTTSKQLRSEMDAKPIGYGTMLLEGLVAVVSLCCVMMLAANSPLLKGGPNFIYARGLGEWLSVAGIPAQLAVAFGLMAFSTFVYDTLDVCTRLGRYIIQELTGWRDAKGKWLATGLTAGVPLFFLLRPADFVDGKRVPIWQTFWSLFGASNQLLAALTLLGVTVWLWRTRGATWVWLVTGLPTVWMYTMSLWALTSIVRDKFAKGNGADPVAWIGIVLVSLAVLMLIEACRILLGARPTPPAPAPEPVPAAT